MKAKLTIMGCGNSTGVPSIGNYWGSCDPNEPKNKRTRCSVLVQTASTSVVIDTGPDFREQLNRTGLADIDAVLYSHAHGDHVNGIDELRTLSMRHKKLMPVYTNKWSLEDLDTRFHYLFKGGISEIYPPVLAGRVIENFGQKMKTGDLEFIPFEQDHGTCMTVGFRFGDTAYSVDLRDLSDGAVDVLKGIKTWIVDGAGYKSPTNKVHASLERIYELNRRIGAERVLITSLSLGMDYQTLRNELLPGYEPAHDGLKLDIDI